MSAEHPPGTDWGRRLKLAPVVLGAMAVSIGGQIAAVEPRMGFALAVVLALTNDAGAIIALDEAMKAPRGDAIRKWAWLAILLVAGTGGALNTWHVVTPLVPAPDGEGVTLPELPIQLAVLIGLEPIALVLVLSHLLGLVTASRQAQSAAGGRQADRQTASAGDRQATHVVVGNRQAADRQTASLDRQVATASIARPPALDRQTVNVSTARPPAASAPGDRQATGAGDRQPSTSPTSRQPAVQPVGHQPRALAAVPAPRPDWMTDDLLRRVLDSMAKAHAERKPYGRTRVIEDHGLSDHRAKTVLGFITEHNLLRRSA